MSKLKRYYLNRPYQFLLILFLKLIVSVCEVSISFLLYTIVNLVTSGADFASFLYLGATSFAIILTLSFGSYSEEYLTHKYVDEITEIYRMDVFRGILNLDLSEMKKKPVGEYLTNLDRDITSVSQQHFSSMFNLISQGFTLAIAIGMAFAFNYIVTLFILAVSLLIVLVPQLFIKKIFATYDEYSLSMSELSKYLENFLNGGHIVQNCDAIHQVSEIVKKVDRSVLKKVNRHWKIACIDNNVVLFLTIFLKFFTVFIACLLYFCNMASIAICVAFLQISSSIYNPLIQVVASHAFIKSVKKVVERLSVFDEKEKEPLYESKIRTPSINLRNLTIAYDEREVLNDVTYDFDFGKKCLLMGKSGIGKSTLLNAIIGYTEIKNGSIDVTDGVDKASNVNETSHLIGYVHQKPFLFIGNLVENITMFSKNPDMDKVTLLIKRCKLDDFASQRGLYAPLDNSSNAISIGEMQRISLARTLYLDRPILFLDEITSSLDEKSAKEINDVIRNIENKLIIWISHNRDMKELSWIDKKIKIENAKIAEI